VLLAEAALLRTHAVHKLFQPSKDINQPVRRSKKRTVCGQSFRKPYRCSYVRYRYRDPPVLRIRNRRIRIFLGLLDPDLLVRGTDPAPDPAPGPSIIKQK
jgi:hypothetical protein